MKLSVNQLERLAERIFKVLKASGHIEIDAEEGTSERILDCILGVLEEDTRMEERLSRDAERLVAQQSEIAQKSNKSMEDLVAEVRTRLAKSKRVLIDDGPDRADSIAEKILKALWRVDGIDFFSEDQKIQNCMARAAFRFRIDDDRLVDAVERIVSKRCEEEPYSPAWCIEYDKYFAKVRERLANEKAPLSTPPTDITADL